MSSRQQKLAAAIADRFGDTLSAVPSTCNELTFELASDDLLHVARALRDDSGFEFDTLIDVCGVD